jgi:Fic family protein
MNNPIENNDSQLPHHEALPENEHAIFYEIPDSLKLKSFLTLCNDLNKEIEGYKPLREDLWATVQDKIMVDWTYHSNAIEGSTLTRGETGFFLQYGLTVKGKPLKDFLDARNHSDAIDFLFEIIKNERPISTSLIKEFNALLLSGVTHTKAINKFGEPVKKIAHPGQYKVEPNHVQQPDGTIHYYAEPIDVSAQIEYLCSWINTHIDKLHPIITGAVAHYNFVRIHPFDDGNGRGARLLMNTILMKKKYPPVVIKNENRQDYIESLIEADNGDLSPFINFISQSLIETQELILNELKRSGKK